MRKSKDIKRKRKQAAAEFRKGNRTEAYKFWGEAAKEMKDLRAPKKKEGAAPSA